MGFGCDPIGDSPALVRSSWESVKLGRALARNLRDTLADTEARILRSIELLQRSDETIREMQEFGPRRQSNA